MTSASPVDVKPPIIAAESSRVLRRELWWFAGVTGLIWLVGLIANHAVASVDAPFDRFVFMLMRSADVPADAIGPGWLGDAARDVTALGSWSVLLAVTATAVGYFVAVRNRLTAAIIAASVIGGMVIGELVKLAVDRARPDLAPHAVDVFTASFPSGHSMSAAAAYLTLGALAAAAQSSRAARAWLMAAAIAVTVLVGLSRLYLAVHWPTDVLAGWSAGALWAIGCLALLRRLQRRSAAATRTTAATRSAAAIAVAAIVCLAGCHSIDDTHRALFAPDAWPPVAEPGDPPLPAQWAQPIDRGGLMYLGIVNDRIYRGCHPKAEQLRHLPEVRTVVNLRSAHDSRDAAAAAGKHYVWVPIEVWAISDDAMLDFLRVATDDRYSPIYVHCNLGSDRTSVALAVYRMVVDRWPRDEAIREMTQGPYGYNEIWINLVDYLEHVDTDALRQRLRDAPPLPPPGPVLVLAAPAADTPAQRPAP